MSRLRYLALASTVALAACGGNSVKDTLGISRKAPDEFRVVSKPPLSVPPQFNLRPPAAPGEGDIVPPAHKQAQTLILGNDPDKGADAGLQPGNADTAVMPVTVSNPGTAAENQLLKNAGADKIDPSVRTVLQQEKAVAQPEEEESWWSTMTTLPSKKEPLVNPKGESERLKKNKDEGKPVTEGETPEMKDKDKGILGKIFGY